MKYLILVWAGLWRKKPRTILTMLSIVVAFLLFGLLQGVNQGFDHVDADANHNRLYTENRYSVADGMPISYANRIAAVPGVTGVSSLTYFGGYYQDRHHGLGAYAVDVPALFKLYPEFKIPSEQLHAMRTTRNGALISRGLATQYGWKVGDNVPIGSSIWIKKDGRTDYEFQIVGIFDVVGMGASGENSFYINYDYFDEARQFGNGTVHFFVSGIDRKFRAQDISKNIDALFTNSSDETRTESAQVFVGNQLRQVADIDFIITAIIGAVFFALLFLTGNTMMQSIRDRIPELAVLKTFGFTDGAVSILVTCESLFMCVVSATIGLGLARLVFIPLSRTLGYMQFESIVVYLGIAIAVALGVVVATPAAWRASRLNVVDALANR